MKVIIELKKQDAEGRGGEILREIGMRETSPCVFVKKHIVGIDDGAKVESGEVNLDQPNDMAHLVPYLQSLTDEGIRPLRVKYHNSSEGAMAPVIGSAQGALDNAMAAIEAATKLLGSENSPDSGVAALGLNARHALRDAVLSLGATRRVAEDVADAIRDSLRNTEGLSRPVAVSVYNRIVQLLNAYLNTSGPSK